MKFVCPLIVVEDIKISRNFYENVLGQKVKDDFGENVTFHGDFAIHLRSHFEKLIDSENREDLPRKKHNFELYFESNNLEKIYEKLTEAGVDFIHPARKQPWGQHVMRFYDPDGHIIEVGEPI